MSHILVLIIIMNFLGSYFYLGNESFSIGFILMPFLLVWIAAPNNLNKLLTQSKTNLLLTVFFFSLLILSIIAYFINDTDNNLRLIKFSINLFLLYLGLLLVSKRNPDILDASVFFTICIISIMCLLQFFYLNTGIGIKPHSEFLTATGPFANPNDLSSISLLMYLYISTLYKWKLKNFISYLSIALIVITASRFAMLAALLIFLSLRLKMETFLKFSKSIPLIASLTIALMLASTDWFKYSIARIGSISEHFSISGATEGSSTYIRIKSLFYFMHNITNIKEGSFEFQNYEYFFTNSEFSYSLISTNPHNFFIEISLLYGYLGSILAFLLLYILIRCRFLFNPKYSILYISIIIISFCITSTVINFLPLWLMLIIILISQRRAINMVR